MSEEKLFRSFFEDYETEDDIEENEQFYLISKKWLLRWFEEIGFRINRDKYYFSNTLPNEMLFVIKRKADNKKKSTKAPPPTTTQKNPENRAKTRYTPVALSYYPTKFRKNSRGKKEKARRRRQARREKDREFYRRNLPKINNDIFGAPQKDAIILLSDGTRSEETTFLPLKENVKLKDYAIIPKDAWDYLVKEHGLNDTSFPVTRPFVSSLKTVEVYPVSTSFLEPIPDADDKKKRIVPVYASKVAKFSSLRTLLSSTYGTDKCKDVNIWLGLNASKLLDERGYDKKKFGLIKDLDNSQLVVGLYNKEEHKKLTKPLSIGTLCGNIWHFIAAVFAALLCIFGIKSWDVDDKYPDNIPAEIRKPGVCGLRNIGNTCFMNSVLQCLSNTPSLATFFMNDEYKEELNIDAVLGTKGQVTEAFVELIRKMWSGTYSCCAPTTFKQTFSKWNSEFSGFSQHDAQEFMSKLLNNLHEDLNHVKSKPYFENPSCDGTQDESEVAKETWNNFVKRDDSIITHEFYGQLRNELVCAECGEKSITFTSFESLTLPTPPPKKYIVECTVVFKDDAVPVKYGIELPETPRTLVRDLRIKLEVLTGRPGIHLVLLSGLGVIIPGNCYIPDGASKLTFYEIDINIKGKSPMLFIRNVTIEKEEPEEGDKDDNDEESDEEEDYNDEPIVHIGVPSLIQLNETEKEPSDDDDDDDNDNKGDIDDDYDSDEESDDEDENIGLISVSSLYEQIWSKMKRKVPDYNKNDNEYPFVIFGVLRNDGSLKKELKLNKEDSAVDLQEFVHAKNGASKLELRWREDLINFKNKITDDFFTGVVIDERLSEFKKTFVNSQDPTLDGCMKIFASEEELNDDDGWYCSKCCKHVSAKKKADIWKLPNKLIIHMKETLSDVTTRRTIDFKIDSWDLAPYVLNPEMAKEPHKYRLYGLIHHRGTINSGHYVAYARNRNDGNWYLFNDELCKQVTPQEVEGAKPYVLFYEKIEADESDKKLN